MWRNKVKKTVQCGCLVRCNCFQFIPVNVLLKRYSGYRVQRPTTNTTPVTVLLNGDCVSTVQNHSIILKNRFKVCRSFPAVRGNIKMNFYAVIPSSHVSISILSVPWSQHVITLCLAHAQIFISISPVSLSVGLKRSGESIPDLRLMRPMCYRYTTALYLKELLLKQTCL